MIQRRIYKKWFRPIKIKLLIQICVINRQYVHIADIISINHTDAIFLTFELSYHSQVEKRRHVISCYLLLN